jgi:hypothetical protein
MKFNFSLTFVGTYANVTKVAVEGDNKPLSEVIATGIGQQCHVSAPYAVAFGELHSKENSNPRCDPVWLHPRLLFLHACTVRIAVL